MTHTDQPTTTMHERPPHVKLARKVVIGVTGGTVTAAGVAMLFLPGPGIATIAGGLAILGSEFPAARRTLDKAKARARSGLRRSG